MVEKIDTITDEPNVPVNTTVHGKGCAVMSGLFLVLRRWWVNEENSWCEK